MNMPDLRRAVASGLEADQVDTWNNPTRQSVGIALTTDDGCTMYIVVSHADAARIGWDLVNASAGVESDLVAEAARWDYARWAEFRAAQ